jgi:hypothetical protein
MSSLQSSEGTQVNEGAEASSKLESEIGELVRRDTAPRLQQGIDNELNVGSLVQKVSGTSVQDVEKLIAELQILRGKLQNEAARMQRKMVGYAVLLQDARKSIGTISESLSWLKKGPAAPKVGA